jgi:hypothetical protein
MRYSCRAVVGHGQVCEPNYQCDACASKQKYIPRIEKLEAALRSVLQYRLTDETWVKLGFDPKKIRVEFDAARKALERKDD